jgi:hypothetical protein
MSHTMRRNREVTVKGLYARITAMAGVVATATAVVLLSAPHKW